MRNAIRRHARRVLDTTRDGVCYPSHTGIASQLLPSQDAFVYPTLR
jgi:hypothetical protein